MRIFFLVFLFASQALAQSYPSRPVKLVVGFAPGGAADFVARVFADPLSRALGAPIVVENKPGAGSSIAAESVAKAAPDGYTVLIASPSSILVNPLLNPNPGFQPLRDLAPVSKVSASPLVVAVNPGVGVSSLRELIDHAKKNPGKLNFATSGNGAAPHLAAVLFQRLAGVVKRLFDATGVVLQNTDVNRALAKEGTETSGSRSPPDFAAFLAEDTLLWTRLVKDSGAKPD